MSVQPAYRLFFFPSVRRRSIMYTIIVSSTLTGEVIHMEDDIPDDEIADEADDWRSEPYVEVQTINQDDGFPY
jgi:hypothetical protein